MDAQTWQLISIIGYSLAGLLFIIAIIMFIKMNIWSVIGDLTGRTAAKQIQEIREQNARTGNKQFRPSAFNLERGKLTEPVGSRRLALKGKPDRSTTKGLRKFMTRGLTGETSRPGITRNLPTDQLPQQEHFISSGVQNSSPVFENTRVLTGNKMPLVNNETTVLGYQATSQGDSMSMSDHKATAKFAETTVLRKELAAEVDATTVLDDRKDSFVDATTLLDNGTEVLADGTEVLNGGTDVLDQGTEVLLQEQDFGTTVLNPTEDLSNEEHVSQAVDFKVVKDIKIIHTDRVI